jgi:MFS family permease
MTGGPRARVELRRPFGVWLGAATLSTLGDAVSFFALGWTAAAHGAGAASLVLTAESLPLCLLILVGGLVADRLGVRRTMAACDAAMVVVMTVLAVCAVRGVPLWGLVAVALAAGTASALRRPAEGVFPRLFAATDDELARTMAATATAAQLARVAGPTVGGLLVGAGGLSLTSAVDAVSFALVLAVLLVVRPPGEHLQVRAEQRPLGHALAETFRTAARTPGVPALLATVVGLAVTVLPLVMLCLPLLGRERGWSAGQTGVVSAAWLVGGAAVTLVVARRGLPGTAAAGLGPLLAAAAVVALAATDEVLVAAGAMVAVGVGTTLLTSRLMPTFVVATPPTMLARFQALIGLAQTGPVLLATPALGVVASHGGVTAALAAVAVGLAGTAVLARASGAPAPPDRHEDQEAVP